MAVSFNGTNSVIDMGTGSALNLAQNAPIALTCWIRPHDFTSNQQFLGKGYDGTNTAYGFQILSSQLLWGSFSGAFHGVTWASITWTIDTWHHVYGDFTGTSGGSWSLYVDGILVAGPSAVGRGPESTAQKFAAGAIDVTGAFQNFLNGCLADVALLNGPLAGTEITNLAAGSLRPNTGMSQTLLGYWKLDSAAATQTDFSVNGNTGTAAGGAITDTCGSSPPYIAPTLVLMGQICA